jgi:nitric oxide synthase-interacting protein
VRPRRPDGYVYEKEVILENLLAQRRELKRRAKEYERAVARSGREAADAVAAATAARVAAFAAAETRVASAAPAALSLRAVAAAAAGTGPGPAADPHRGLATLPSAVAPEPLKTAKGNQKAALPSFWLPSNAPEAKASLPEKPDDVTRCPMSQQPLSLKDLVDVHFTEADPTSSVPLISRSVRRGVLFVRGPRVRALTVPSAAPQERYMCPVTQTVLRQHVPCIVLRPTGTVVTRDCYEKLIAPDMVDPLTGGRLGSNDIIHIRNGGTGFSASAASVAAVKKPSLSAG